MNLLIRSFLLIASIPFIAFALAPTNPAVLCERFIGEKDMETCKARTDKESVDWYAATVCNLQKEDAAFWKCWDSVKDQKISPQALISCGENEQLTDPQRQNCVNKALLGERSPASSEKHPAAKSFQDLKL